MKKIWAAVLAALFFVSCAPKHDAGRIEIKGRIRAAKLADELKGIRMIFYVADIKTGKSPLKKALYQQGKKLRVDYLYELNGVDYTRKVDTFTGKWGMWKNDTWTGNAEADSYPKEYEARFTFFPAWFERLSAKKIYKGDEKIDGFDCYVLETERENGSLESFRIDKNTLLVVRWNIKLKDEKSGKIENLEYRYNNPVILKNGFTYFSRVDGFQNGSKNIEITVKNMETGVDFEKKAFDAYEIDIVESSKLEKMIKFKEK